MRVSELSGALLDYWVLVAEGSKGPQYIFLLGVWHATDCGVPVFYSRSWAEGGPLIDREGISLKMLVQPRTTRPGDICCEACYLHGFNRAYGATLLEAAMRSYVKSKFGDVVPDEVHS
jgi:hypothetical protein